MHSSTASECSSALQNCQQHVQQQWCSTAQQQHLQYMQHLPECSAQWHLSATVNQQEGPLHPEYQLHQRCQHLHQAMPQQLTQISQASTSQLHSSPQLCVLHELAKLLTAAQQHLRKHHQQQQAQQDAQLQPAAAHQQQWEWHTPLPGVLLQQQQQHAQLHSLCHQHQHAGIVPPPQQLQELQEPVQHLQQQPIVAEVHQQQALLQLVGDKQAAPGLYVKQQQIQAAAAAEENEEHTLEHNEQEQQQQMQQHQIIHPLDQKHNLSPTRQRPVLLRRRPTRSPVKRSHAGSGRPWSSPRSRLCQSSSTCAAVGLLQNQVGEAASSGSAGAAAAAEVRQHQYGAQRASTVDLEQQQQQQEQQQHNLAGPVGKQTHCAEEEDIISGAVATCVVELTTTIKSMKDADSKTCKTASPAAASAVAAAAGAAASLSMDASPARVKSLVDQLEQRLSTLQNLLHSPVDPEPSQQQRQYQAGEVHALLQHEQDNPQQEYCIRQQQQQQELKPLQQWAACTTLVRSDQQQLEHCMLGSPACSDYSTGAAAGSCCSGESAGVVAVLDAATQTPPSVKCSSSNRSSKRTVSCQVGCSRSNGNTAVTAMLETPCSLVSQNGTERSGPDEMQWCSAAVVQQQGGCQHHCKPSPDGWVAAVAPACSVHGFEFVTGCVDVRGSGNDAEADKISNSSSTCGSSSDAASGGGVLTAVDCAGSSSSSSQQQGPGRCIPSSSSDHKELHRESAADDVAGSCRRQLSWDQDDAKTVQQTASVAALDVADQHASVAVQQQQQCCMKCKCCKHGNTAAVAELCSAGHSIPQVMPSSAGSNRLSQDNHRRQRCTSLNLSRGGAAVLRADECSEGLVFALLLASKKPVKE